MSTVRIDTFRNQVAATVQLLTKVSAEVVDLHALAYDRSRAVGERVAGGATDYALDTHGDPKAREAYRAMSDAMCATAESLAIAAHTALRRLRESDQHPPRRGRRHIDALELAEKLAAQARRQMRGDDGSVRGLPQPDRDVALQRAVDELDEERLARQMAEAETASLRIRIAELEALVPAADRAANLPGHPRRRSGGQ